MSSINKVIIIGHLGRDPETRYTPSGDCIANISVATTDSWKDKQTGEKKEQTEWHRVSAFGRLAEVMGQYLMKGSLVYVEGSLRTRKYTDKDGIEKYSTEIRCDNMKMLGSRDGNRQQRTDGEDLEQQYQSRQQGKPQGQRPAPAQANFADMDDDIPFDIAYRGRLSLAI